eukprot:6050121-Pyramimonas_sp.AAC.1
MALKCGGAHADALSLPVTQTGASSLNGRFVERAPPTDILGKFDDLSTAMVDVEKELLNLRSAFEKADGI